jgi:hypothetical protein
VGIAPPIGPESRGVPEILGLHGHHLTMDLAHQGLSAGAAPVGHAHPNAAGAKASFLVERA